MNAAYAVSAGTRHPDACWQLLEGLTDDAAMKGWAATGRIPALSKSAATRVLGDDLGAGRVLYEADAIQLYYDQLLPPELAEMHKHTTQALFAKSMTPEEAAGKMAETGNR